MVRQEGVKATLADIIKGLTDEIGNQPNTNTSEEVTNTNPRGKLLAALQDLAEKNPDIANSVITVRGNREHDDR